MTPTTITRSLLGLTLAAVVSVAGCDDPAQPTPLDEAPAAQSAMDKSGAHGASFLRLYSRNVFLGGEAEVLFDLNFQDPASIIAAVNDFWSQVQGNDFQERAAAIADEIADTDPHVVGLQEITRYAIVDVSSGAPQVVGGLDMLQVLQAALASRGLDYDLVWRQVFPSRPPRRGCPTSSSASSWERPPSSEATSRWWTSRPPPSTPSSRWGPTRRNR